MGVLKKFALAIWRLWFYILLGLPIIIMLPVLLVVASSEKFYPQYFICARIWAKCILYGMGLFPKVRHEQHMEKDKSYMLVANHTSMVDIMLMLAVNKHPFIFVGKMELAKIPLFGYFYRQTCILVDRKSQRSRQEAFNEAQRRLKQGNSICIFPEGGVPGHQKLLLDEFKDGAFRLAVEHQIPVVPFTFYDTKKRFSYDFFSGGPGKLRAKVHRFIPTKGMVVADKRALKEKTHEVILQELKNPSFN
ncbi:lysophospholipid acyltransferase family protein [Autumnicola edwardsiae]|uniref:1-acyl-sn-glycerol-3-phosphate acyltransferase n=1 Tax=Autumnicola edwardsiae TaxID=3075594 RepID=A0ABU3CSD4_9FLAO|nr:lysophospholipid acyltransferase family protein [Zunongwangia sp. F297]MDT0649260.1 lysophospholipid acyltransferase family protein [Zunongwangia sp. F297]